MHLGTGPEPGMTGAGRPAASEPPRPAATGAVDSGKPREAGVKLPAGIALVTDSTCDLPEADKLRYGTTAVRERSSPRMRAWVPSP